MSSISNYFRDTPSEETKHLERIASLDFQRGLAIFIMIFVHGAANIIDYSYIEEDPSIVQRMPIPILLIFVILAFFAVWNSYFLLISVTVNSYAMVNGIKNNKDPNRILFKQLLTGGGLLLVNIFQQSFLAAGYFGFVLKTGDWSNTYPLWNGFFQMGTLRIIGWSLIILSVLMYFLLRNDGYKKFYRNITILGVLALIVIIPSQFISNWVDSIDWIIPTQLPAGVDLSTDVWWPNQHFQALNASIKAWFCALISGDVEPLFPFLATAFIGGIIGLCLSNPDKIKRFPLIGGLSGVGCMGIGVPLLIFHKFTFGTMRPSIGNYFLMLGGQLCSMFFFLWIVEFRGKSQRFGDNIIVKHFRLWGMASLSLFVLDIADTLPRWLFGIFYNLIFNTNINTIPGCVFGQGQEHIALLYALISLIFFEIIILIWSRINFFLSFEWCIVRLVGVITKQPSKRLEVDIMMNNVKWINFRDKKPQIHDVVLTESK